MQRRHIKMTVIALGLVLIPVVVSAALLPVCNSTIGANGKFTDPCGFRHLIELSNNLLRFIVTISSPIAAVAFAYAGYLYMTAMGNTGQISKAHSIFKNVAIGFGIVISAWLVVDVIMDTLAVGGEFVDILGNNPPPK